MEVSSRNEKGAILISIQGRVDAVTAPTLEEKLTEFAEGESNNLIVNLSELEYISSAGLRVILVTAKKMKARQGDILLVGLTGSVKEVFEISGFGSIFRIFDTEESALEQV